MGRRLRDRGVRVAIACTAVLVLGGCSGGEPSGGAKPTEPTAAPLSGYDEAVLADHPVGYWRDRVDLTGNGRDGDFTGNPRETVMPNGDTAPEYDGDEQFLTIPDAPELSASRTGVLTLEAWLRPDTLQFKNVEDEDNYVHWLGKGSPGNHEYVARMYSLENEADRPNRISGYAFNLEGGQGAGSNFEDEVRTGEWIYFALVINSKARDPRFPTGYVQVFKNGRLRDMDSLEEYNIDPKDGSAPLRVATRDLGSFFEGAIGKVAVYDHELIARRLLTHYRLMVR